MVQVPDEPVKCSCDWQWSWCLIKYQQWRPIVESYLKISDQGRRIRLKQRPRTCGGVLTEQWRQTNSFPMVKSGHNTHWSQQHSNKSTFWWRILDKLIRAAAVKHGNLSPVFADPWKTSCTRLQWRHCCRFALPEMGLQHLKTKICFIIPGEDVNGIVAEVYILF